MRDVFRSLGPLSALLVALGSTVTAEAPANVGATPQDGPATFERARFGIARQVELEGRPAVLAVDELRERLWIADEVDARLQLLDTRTWQVLDSLDVAEPAAALAVDRDRLYIALPTARQLAIVDLATHVELGTVDLTVEPRALAVTDDAHVWIGGALARVERVDALARITTGPLDVGASGETSCGIGLSPSRRRLYVCRGSEQLSAVDLDALVVDRTLAIGNIPLDLDVNERTGRAYLAISASGTVQVVDLDAWSLLAAGEVGDGTSDVVSSDDGGLFAAIAPLDDTLGIFDGRDNARLSLVDLPDAPAAIAIETRTRRCLVAVPEIGQLIVVRDLARRLRPPFAFDPPGKRGFRRKGRGERANRPVPSGR